MEKNQFNIQINATVNKVYDMMLGLSNIKTYEQWTSIFNPTSTYEGNWNKGSKILFVGMNDKAEKGGMVSQIEENIPNKFVSIKHIGMLVAGKEITEGPDVESWTGMLENYTFEENNEITLVSIELDTPEDFAKYMNQTYPKALNKLKEICEE
jgi:hypothetical protein